MPIRLSTRAVLLHQDRLLLVNAFPGERSDLWCAPGGGAEPGQSLPDNLAREVHEETGLSITVGVPCLVNEFHSPESRFHQVDIFFRCALASGALDTAWQDPEGVVHRRRWFRYEELDHIRLKPDSLPQVAFFGGEEGAAYDPLERLLPR